MARSQKPPGQQDWEAMLTSLASARRRPRTGRIDLVNAIVFAARCAASDHPRWIDAQTATTELVCMVGALIRQRSVTNRDIVQTVDYVVEVALLDTREVA